MPKRYWRIILIILVLEVILIFYNVRESIAIPTILVITLIMVIWDYSQTWFKAIKLINRGKFDEAEVVLNKIHGEYKGRVGYNNQGLYNMAICYSAKGEIEKSISILEEAKSKFDNNSRAGYLSLYATNLILLEKDLDIAEKYVDESIELANIPSNFIQKAYLLIQRGKSKEADVYLNKFNVERTRNKRFVLGFRTILSLNNIVQELLVKYLLGMYFFQKGDYHSAVKYFDDLSNYDFNNIYTEKAREKLEEIKY